MADRDDVIIDDDENAPGFARFIPALVVLFAFGGFISLAWYAYHTGTQSVNEEDLVVVEADKTPMKEKPMDPGGMKFMNQDKSIYDTFSGNQANPPKVEHVMPAPEEPIAKPEPTSDTQTWVNDKITKDVTDKKAEQILTSDKQKNAAAAQQVVKPVDAARAKSEDSGIVTHVATTKSYEEKKPAEHVAEALKPTETKAVISESISNKVDLKLEKAKAEAAKPSATGAAKIQLGAYASEEEAKNAWGRLQKKFPELADKTVYVVKADLGAKGIFYRLRAGGVGDAAAAKSLCAKLTAKGQACLVP